MKITRPFSIAFILFSGFFYPTLFAAVNSVVPIKWSNFTEPFPKDSNALLEKECLNRSIKYYTGNWYSVTKKFSEQTVPYLDFGGITEHFIRHPGAVAYSEALAIKLKLIDTSITKTSINKTSEQCRKILTSLAYQHLSNKTNGWGNLWQSALWAFYAGAAGWIMWDELSTQDQEYVRKMVEYEANRFNDREPDYASKLGTLTKDTKAEENSWNVGLIGLAVAMMPNHQNAPKWRMRLVQYSIAAYPRPSDDSSNTTVINGKSVKDWIDGYNIMEDGLLYNHSRMHPDYIASIQQQINNIGILGLAAIPAPKAALFNFDIEYKVLVDYNFKTADKWDAPGGTIYIDNSEGLYYPQQNDWGTHRRACFALLDAYAHLYKSDLQVTQKGPYWESLHIRKLKQMQERHVDGHTYATPGEDTYIGREEWVTAHGTANACLAYWIVEQPGFSISNIDYSKLTPNYPATLLNKKNPNESKSTRTIKNVNQINAKGISIDRTTNQAAFQKKIKVPEGIYLKKN